MIIIGNYFPNAQASIVGDPSVYENITWITTPISQVDLDVANLTKVKTDRIIELSASARQVIVNGFHSSALGSDYVYDSAPEDQLNLVGVVASGADTYFSCRDPNTLTKTYILHTISQLHQVIADGKDIKLAVLQKFTAKQAAILACTTESQVNVITWVSTP